MFFKAGKTSVASDEELLLLYRLHGDPEYFGQLYNRYIPLVYGLCLKYLRQEEQARDAVMQLYEDLALKINNHEIKVFRVWLYSVAKNHCLQILKKQNREIFVDFSESFMESDPICHLFEKEDDEDRYEALEKCLEKLPEPQKISISKFFMEEMSYADIAEDTGYRVKSVKSYIQNGKRNLKICMENQPDQ